MQKKVNQLFRQRIPSHFESRFFNLSGLLDEDTSAISKLNPLLWYNPATLTTSSFWENQGSIGPEYDLTEKYGAGGTVVNNPELGTVLRASNASRTRGGLNVLSGSGMTTITAPFTIGVVYNVDGSGQEYSMFTGNEAVDSYSYIRSSTRANTAIAKTGGATSINTKQFENIPSYQIVEYGSVITDVRGKYAPSATAARGVAEMIGLHLGSSQTYSNTFTNPDLEIATLFIVSGTVKDKVEAAILEDFPFLIGDTSLVPASLIDYDARELALANSASISSWTNTGTGGTDWDLAQAAAANQPLYLTDGDNGAPAVLFNDTTDVIRMVGSGVATWDRIIIGIVYKAVNIAGSSIFFNWKSGGGNLTNSILDRDTSQQVSGDGSPTVVTGASISGWQSLCFDLTDPTAPLVSVNGAQPSTLPSLVTISDPSEITIGKDWNNLGGWDWATGRLGRVVMYNSDPGISISSISGRLKSQWNF